MRPPITLLVGAVILATPVTALAGPALPEEVVAGQEVTLDLGTDAAMIGAVVTLRPAAGEGKVVAGRASAGADGTVKATFAWPARYQRCDDSGACVERSFLPGQGVDVAACSVPVTSGVPGLILASSQACVGASTIMGGRAARVRLPGGVAPRRVGKLSGARWNGWGKAVAQARGVVGGRSATALARDIVDCDGRLWYSTVEIRSGGRVQRVRDVAPC
jgi:hypothetical protein